MGLMRQRTVFVLLRRGADAVATPCVVFAAGGRVRGFRRVSRAGVWLAGGLRGHGRPQPAPQAGVPRVSSCPRLSRAGWQRLAGLPSYYS